MNISLKKVFLLFLGVFSFFSCKNEENTVVENLSQYVEPRIGTAHCRWFHFAPGAMPFGMAKPAPSTMVVLEISPVGRLLDMIIVITLLKVFLVCMSFRLEEYR